MTLTVIKQPEKVMLNKNPIVLGINTDNKYSSAGTKGVKKIRFLGGVPANNDFFSVNVDDVSYIFVLKDDGTASTTALEINRNNTSVYANIPSWITYEVIPVIRRVLSIRDYYVTEITFDGSFYNLNFTDIEYNTTHVINLGVSSTQLYYDDSTDIAPVARVARTNYKLYCSIYATRTVSGQIIFDKVTELEGEPDASGNVYFNINRALVIEDNERPNALNYSDTNAQVSLHYRLFYGEKYGDPIVYQSAKAIGQSTDIFALNGALAENVWPTTSFYTKTINAATPLFLNLHPRKLTVSRSQPLWLYYFYNHTTGGWRLRYKSYDVDGTDNTSTLSTSSTNYTNQILAINTSPGQIGVGDSIYKYQIWVEKQDGTVISEVMTYILSELDYEHNRFFLYRNSWGCYETIWCHGKAEYGKTFDYETAQVYVPTISTTVKAASKSYGAGYEQTVDISTGIKGREDAFDGAAYREYLTDFMNSEERYEILGEQFLPIELLVKTEPFGGDTDTIFAQTFKYKYSFKNKGFTPSWL
jgi:hypothetical protein